MCAWHGWQTGKGRRGRTGEPEQLQWVTAVRSQDTDHQMQMKLKIGLQDLDDKGSHFAS
jgi:hypothetical protein